MPCQVTCANLLAHFLDVIGNLRDQYDVGGRCNPGVQGDEARMPAHDLEHNHPVVTLGCCVQLVDCFDGSVHRSVEPERRHCSADVVVDRLRHADNSKPAPHQLKRDTECAVAANCHKRIDT